LNKQIKELEDENIKYHEEYEKNKWLYNENQILKEKHDQIINNFEDVIYFYYYFLIFKL
jgi:hypothetical protein